MTGGQRQTMAQPDEIMSTHDNISPWHMSGQVGPFRTNLFFRQLTCPWDLGTLSPAGVVPRGAINESAAQWNEVPAKTKCQNELTAQQRWVNRTWWEWYFTVQSVVHPVLDWIDQLVFTNCVEKTKFWNERIYASLSFCFWFLFLFIGIPRRECTSEMLAKIPETAGHEVSNSWIYNVLKQVIPTFHKRATTRHKEYEMECNNARCLSCSHNGERS